MDKVKKLQENVVRELGKLYPSRYGKRDLSIVQALMLAVHVEACGLRLDEANSEYKECGEHGHLCATAKAIKELGDGNG